MKKSELKQIIKEVILTEKYGQEYSQDEMLYAQVSQALKLFKSSNNTKAFITRLSDIVRRFK